PATATTAIYTLSLHDALPICAGARSGGAGDVRGSGGDGGGVLRRAAARGRHLFPEGRVGVSAELVRAARAAQQQAYCPYSKFRRSEEHTSELQSLAYLVCRLL